MPQVILRIKWEKVSHLAQTECSSVPASVVVLVLRFCDSQMFREITYSLFFIGPDRQ